MAAGLQYCVRGLFRQFPSTWATYRAEKTILCIGHGTYIKMTSDTRLYSLVVGLGNHSMPATRHSVGMAVVSHLANKLGVQWQHSRKFQGHLAITKVDNHDVILLKPKLAMNINGRCIVRVVAEYNIQPCDVILVHDDLDKPLGKCSMKYGGSAGGHNGVKSSIGCLMSVDMKRLRVGIGRPTDRSQVTDYVLQNFSALEKPIVKYVMEDCVDIVLTHLKPLESGKDNGAGRYTGMRKKTGAVS